jgi:hypothetical protein
MMRSRIAELVPEARILVGHGQMEKDDLEVVMHTFVKGEADVLLATTIIETGIDIPTPTPSSSTAPTASAWPISISSAAASAAPAKKPTPSCCCRAT